MSEALIVVPSLEQPGGVANYYRTLDLERVPNIAYLQIAPRHGPRLREIARGVKLLAAFWRATAKAPVVLLNPSMGNRAVARDGLLAVLALLRRRRVIVFWRGWDWRFYEQCVKKSRAWKWFLRASLLRAHTVITLGEPFERELRVLAGGRNVSFVRESTVADDRYLDVEPQQLIERRSLSAPTILFMSRLDKGKGVLTALRTFELLKRRMSCARMVIAGDGPELPEAKRLVARQSLQDVRFVGHVVGEEKHRVMLEATLLLFPTAYGEGMPNVVLEAMLYGLPVVTRNNGGIAEVVQHDVNGCITDSEDPSVLADMTARLVEDKAVYRAMALRNAKTARIRFSPMVVRKRLLTLLGTS